MNSTSYIPSPEDVRPLDVSKITPSEVANERRVLERRLAHRRRILTSAFDHDVAYLNNRMLELQAEIKALEEYRERAPEEIRVLESSLKALDEYCPPSKTVEKKRRGGGQAPKDIIKESGLEELLKANPGLDPDILKRMLSST